MARSKGTPERSRLVRSGVQAFAKKQKTTTETDALAGDEAKKDEAKAEAKKDEPKAEAKKDEPKAEAKKDEAKKDEPKKDEAKAEVKSDDSKAEAKKDEAKNESKAEAKPVEPATTEGIPAARSDAETQPIQARPDPKDLPEIEPPSPRAEPWPDATPPPMKPVEAPRPSRSNTVAMPQATDLGKPPDMPRESAPPPLALGAVEDPTHMPGPKDVPAGGPDDPAPPPGHVPPGDSRSLRRNNEFALVYRVGTCVITRTGVVGTRGTWRVVEYPTSAFASNSYAKECSRFVTEGFSDYRE